MLCYKLIKNCSPLWYEMYINRYSWEKDQIFFLWRENTPNVIVIGGIYK